MKYQSTISPKMESLIHQDTVLFFDMDGTLVDTDYANYMAYKEAVETVTSLKFQILYREGVRIDRKLIKRMFSKLSHLEYEQVMQYKQKAYSKYLNRTILHEQVANVLRFYSTSNQNVLVTNSCQSRAFTTLKYHHIFKLFSDKICRVEVSKEKNKYDHAIKKLEVNPHNVIVFENELSEIQNAIHAGIPSDNIFNP